MKYAALFAVLPFAACVEAAPPMVSDYNGNIVKVIYHTVPLDANYRASPIYQTAVETCGSEAVYQGMRRVSQYQGEHTFLCRK